jgi:ABC-type multidrug transport system ATPase subunit
MLFLLLLFFLLAIIFPMPPIITVQNMRKTYGKTVAVDDVSFEVTEGEIFGLLGPNGAGNTTGLDPAARRITWDLIRAIRDRGTTVVLVTHFMDEAENLCDRLAIVDRGKIIATDSPQGVITGIASEVRIIFTTEKTELAWLEEVPGVKRLTRRGPRVELEGSGPVLALVAAALVEHGIVPADLRVEQPTLEDVFLKLTGHAAGSAQGGYGCHRGYNTVASCYPHAAGSMARVWLAYQRFSDNGRGYGGGGVISRPILSLGMR